MKIVRAIPTDRAIDQNFHLNWVELPDPPRGLILFSSLVISVLLVSRTCLGSFFEINPDEIFWSALALNAKMLFGFLTVALIHEFLHLVVLFAFDPKADIYLIANIKFASIFVYTEQVISKTQFFIVALTPLCLLSLLPLWLLHHDFLRGNFLGMLAVLNLAGSIPDVANALFVSYIIPNGVLFRNLNNKAYCQNAQDEIGVSEP